MDIAEQINLISKEIKDLDAKISKADEVSKADVKKLIDRLADYDKVVETAEESEIYKGTASFWKSKKTAMEFCDFLADGPLAFKKDAFSGSPLHKDRLNKISDAGSVGTSADGGYLAPSLFSSYILDRGLSYGQTLSLFPRQQVAGKDLDIATNDTDLSAKFAVAGGGTTSEDHTKTADKMTFGHVTLTPKTVYAVRFASNKLLRQSRFAIANIVGNDLAKSINKLMAYCVWKADGTNDATNGDIDGIKTKSGIGEVNLTTASQLYTTSATGSPADSDATVKGMDAIVKMMNLATSRAYQPDSGFFMHRITLNNLYSIKDTTGNPIIRDVFVQGYGLRPTIRGYPVFIEEIFDHADQTGSVGDMLVAFGSPSQGGVIGYTDQLAISFSDHVRWLNNQSGWKAEMELDFQVTDVGAWSRIMV